MYPVCILDARQRDQVTVIVWTALEERQRSVEFTSRGAESCIWVAKALCGELNIELKDIRALIIVPGSERFTIARLAQVYANALRYALAIPVYESMAVPTRSQYTEEGAFQSVLFSTAHYTGEPTMN